MMVAVAREERRRGRDGAQGLPSELRRLWGLKRASRRGRPAELDVERVVRAAVALADREGLPAATLPGIAKTLGYSTMALYRYVGSKSALLALMRDFAIGAPPEISPGPDRWRPGLRQWACAERLLNQRRPWLARLPISGPPSGPNQVAWMEAGLRALRETGLDWGERLGLLTLITGYVRQSTLLSEDLERGRKASGLDQRQAERRYGRSLMKLIDPDKFPETARLLRSGIFEAAPAPRRDDPASDPAFRFGLERILDGAAVAIARTGRARPGSGRAPASAHGGKRPPRRGK
jgi:AcrR family transcriptional regulator